MAIKRKSIFAGALMLTSAGLITRALGFVYRISMSNTLGAEGMGLYQLIMPVYSLAWSIACSGFTTTLSKLVAQENASRAYGNMGRALKQAIAITGVISLTLTAVLFFGAGAIGTHVFNDARTVLPLRILSAAIPFMAAGSCIRGYFLGLRETTEPAFGQVLEQCTRMAVVYLLAPLFLPRGLAYACAAAVIGIVAGECIAFAFSLTTYIRFKRKNNLTAPPTKSSRLLLTTMVGMALPLTANRITGSFLSAWENTLIPQQLRAFGMTQAEAVSAYGRINGMALPLIFFPSAVLTALSVTLVPAISEAIATDNRTKIRATAEKAIRFTCLVGICAAAVFLVLPDELGRVIYKQELGELLVPLAFLCPFWYLNAILGGILNGLGQQTFIFRNSLLSSAVNIGFIYFLVPLYGIQAFLWGWTLTLLCVTAISLAKIKAETGLRVSAPDWLYKPLLAALAAALLGELAANHIIFVWFHGFFALFAAAGLVGGLFLLAAFALGCFTSGELRLLLGGLRIRPRERAAAAN